MGATQEKTNLLERLRLGANEAFETLYFKYYTYATTYVRRNHGNEMDARDLFQEAIVVLYKKLSNGTWRNEASIGTFLYAVVVNIWKYKLRQANKHPVYLGETPNLLSIETIDIWEEDNIEESQNNEQLAVLGIFNELSENCQKLLELSFFNQLQSEEIAKELGYSEAFVRVKKHRCIEKIREKWKLRYSKK